MKNGDVKGLHWSTGILEASGVGSHCCEANLVVSDEMDCSSDLVVR